MSAFESIRATRQSHDGGMGSRLSGMLTYRRPSSQEPAHRSRLNRDAPVSFSNGSKALRSPSFDPSRAPEGARLLPLGELGDEACCMWPHDAPGGPLFCGLPLDPAAGSRLTQRYCAHHGALVTTAAPPLKLYMPKRSDR